MRLSLLQRVTRETQLSRSLCCHIDDAYDLPAHPTLASGRSIAHMHAQEIAVPKSPSATKAALLRPVRYSLLSAGMTRII